MDLAKTTLGMHAAQIGVLLHRHPAIVHSARQNLL
jgi:hypothetical protein